MGRANGGLRVLLTKRDADRGVARGRGEAGSFCGDHEGHVVLSGNLQWGVR